jgi:acyl carrier protein
MSAVTDVGAGIREALAVRLKRDTDAIRNSDDLRNDLGLDSLDMIELLFKIEEVFGLEIPNEDLTRIATVGDVIAYVERRLAAKAAAPPRAGVALKKPAAPKRAQAARPVPSPAPAVAAVAAPARDPAPDRGRSARRRGARARPAPKRAPAKKRAPRRGRA